MVLSSSLRTPSLQALLVFEAAARNLSFTRAAAELHVTPVAVSRMVARLEDTLDFKLFVRGKPGLSLTEEGEVLRDAVASGFGQVSAALAELRRRRQAVQSVTLSITGGLAAQWLLPRHQRFHETFPAIHLRLQVLPSRLLGPLDGADLGIRLHGEAPENDGCYFCPEVIVPMCGPGYLACHGALDAPSGSGHTLIHLDPTPHSWDEFFGLAGLDMARADKSLSYSDAGLAMQSALMDQGVLLGWLVAVAAPWNAGKLVPACSQAIETGCHYLLEFSARKPPRQVSRVAEWLLAEMRDELARLQPALGGLRQVRGPAIA